MNERAGRRVAVAVACALLVSCASEPSAPPTTVQYRPAQRSTLLTKRDLNFLVAQWRRGEELTTVLAHEQAGAAPHPVARLMQIRQGPDLQVAVQRLSESGSATSRADLESAALEQLYSLVLRQEPQARYCLGAGARPCSPDRDGVSHAEVLHALAAARERTTDRTSAAVPWSVVEMMGAPPRFWDADLVSVRATADQVPMEGLPIYFNRAPHSLCVARTRVDGTAVCRLVDQHGDEDQHDHAAPVVATFPGDVRTDRVLLPTTYVLLAPRIPNVLPGKP